MCSALNETRYKNILSEKVSGIYDLKAMAVYKGREQGIGATIIIPIFITLYNCITFMLLNIGIIIVTPIPFPLPFYTTICIAFKSYIPLPFSARKFLYLVSFIQLHGFV